MGQQMPGQYQQVFRKFDANQGAWMPTWNWSAGLFGVLWYFAKGMPTKGFLYLIAIVFLVSGISIDPQDRQWLYVPVAVFFALMGNYDYYLHFRKRPLFGFGRDAELSENPTKFQEVINKSEDW